MPTVNISSITSRFIPSSITANRLTRLSIIGPQRSILGSSRAANNPKKRISLHSIPNSSRHKPRSRPNRRRLRLLNDHILHLIRSSRHVIRNTSTRMHRKHSLSNPTNRRLQSPIQVSRIIRDIMRQPRVKISLLTRNS